MSKYALVNGMLYVRTDSEDAGWKADAKRAYEALLEIWLNDGSTKEVRRDMDSPPEKLKELFSMYVGELVEAEGLIDWQRVYDEIHKDS